MIRDLQKLKPVKKTPVTEAEMPQKLIPNQHMINSRQFLIEIFLCSLSKLRKKDYL